MAGRALLAVTHSLAWTLVAAQVLEVGAMLTRPATVRALRGVRLEVGRADMRVDVVVRNSASAEGRMVVVSIFFLD